MSHSKITIYCLKPTSRTYALRFKKPYLIPLGKNQIALQVKKPAGGTQGKLPGLARPFTEGQRTGPQFPLMT